MARTAIQVDELSKRYRYGGSERYLALRDKITDLLKRPSPKSPQADASKGWFFALREISFSVEEGEIVGIIGRNGAGKSTLLKILTKITTPTSGHARLNGRVGSLLEVGTGFHPELTGRENVYFNGGILGMKKQEITRRFDDIVSFAETEQFIDTPVKHYSSGMQVRLAFSVAAHLEPDILLVDEVLAVGDLRFQKKCIAMLQEVSQSGRTILFVSHQMNQIRRLCSRAIWLESGQISMNAGATEVVAAYEAASQSPSEPAQPGSRPSGDRTGFLSWDLTMDGGPREQTIRSWNPIRVCFLVHLQQALQSGHCGLALYDSDGTLVWATDAADISFGPGDHRLVFTLPYLPVRPGLYRWRVSLWEAETMLDLWDATPELQVATPPVTHMRDEWTGILNIPAEFETE